MSLELGLLALWVSLSATAFCALALAFRWAEEMFRGWKRSTEVKRRLLGASGRSSRAFHVKGAGR